MATTIRPTLSTKNPYWLPKDRFYELKHFCLQYPVWKDAYEHIDSAIEHDVERLNIMCAKPIAYGKNPAYVAAQAREAFYTKMHMIELSADIADHTLNKKSTELKKLLIEAVSYGYAYDTMLARHPDMNISKGIWKNAYRCFFYNMNRIRN